MGRSLMIGLEILLRPYRAGDEDAALALWRRAWQRTYPAIDFGARLAWWRTRWRDEIVPACAVVIAERGGDIVGFVTVDCDNGYLDQIVVAPEDWGGGIAERLLDEGRKLSSAPLHLHVNTDNARAIRFYEKHGFFVAGEDVNPQSGRPVFVMRAR